MESGLSYLSVALICISLISNNVQLLFMYLFAIHISSLFHVCSHLLPFLKLGCFLIVKLGDNFFQLCSESKYFCREVICK